MSNREILTRTFEAVVTRDDDDTDSRFITLRAVPFGETYEFARGYEEQFVRGAFAKTLKERGNKVVLSVGHDNAWRSNVIGVATEWDEKSDALHMTFEVADIEAGRDALALAKLGALHSASIGFAPIQTRQETHDEVQRTVITEAYLEHVSLVVNPAYTDAEVLSVRDDDSTGNPAASLVVMRQRLALRSI